MKITIPTKLLTALLATYLLGASSAYADSTVTGTGTAGNLFTDTGTVTVNAVNFYLPDPRTTARTANAESIVIQQWTISDGFDGGLYTFNSAVTGSGNLIFNVWKGGTATNTYNFTGNMSAYTGSIISNPSSGQTSGGLILNFNGTARETVSGTGDISLGATALTYNLTGGASTIKNAEIAAKGLTFTGGTADTASSYSVDSLVSVTGGSFNVAANTSVTMNSGSSLTLDSSVTSSLTGTLSFATGSTLDVQNGSSITGTNLSMATGSSINLDVVAGSTSLTLSGLTLEESGTLNLNISSAAGFITGTEFTLLSAEGLSSLDTSVFDITLEGSSSSYSLEFVGNDLVMTILAGAKTVNWSSPTGTWSTDAGETPWDGDQNFADGDTASFTNEVENTTNIVDIVGTVTPAGTISVSGVGDTQFDSAAGASIAGLASLEKNGAGMLKITGAHSFSGGVTLNGGTLSIDQAASLGTGNLLINGGTLAAHGGGTIALDGTKVQLATGTALNVELTDNSTLNLTNASNLNNHTLNLSGEGTFSHDNWAKITRLEIGEGVTFNQTQADANSTTFRIFTGSGTLNINNTSEWKFRIQLDDEDLFDGDINLATSGRAVLYLDGTSAAEQTAATAPRIDLTLGTSSVLVLASQNSTPETLYLSSLSGSGNFRYDWSPDVSTRHVDLQMSVDTVYGGEFLHNSRMGDFLVRSASADTPVKLTLNGVGQNDTAAAGKQVLRVANATVEFSQGAVWNTDIVLEEEDSTLIFNNDTTITRASNAGAISGAGQVVIASAETVTLNNANSYSGGTSISENNTLKLGSNTAAGTGKIEMNANTELILADGVSAGNDIHMYSSAKISTAAGESATLTGNIVESTAGSDLTLAGNITISNSTVGVDLVLESSSNVILDNVTLDAATQVTAGAGATVSYVNIEMTGSTVVDAGKLPTFETSQGTTEENVQAFTISGLNAAIVQSTTDSLTLDILMDTAQLDAFNAAYNNGEIVVFELDGITSLDPALDYTNITLDINNGAFTQGILGFTNGGTGGNIMLYIPEPSTATLSLLALAGLLARRRRQAAA